MLDGRGARCSGDGGAITKDTGALLVVDAITGVGTMPLDIDGWGLDIVIGGFAKKRSCCRRAWHFYR